MKRMDTAQNTLPAGWPIEPKSFEPIISGSKSPAAITSHPKVPVKISLLDHNTYGLPKYGSDLSSGFDLNACIVGTLVIYAGETIVIPNGIKVAIPRGYELQVRSRSGLSIKGLTVANSPGTVDADYRGEIKTIITYNPPPRVEAIDSFEITPGMRISQAVICPVFKADFIEISEEQLNKDHDTDRGSGGFGYTGV